MHVARRLPVMTRAARAEEASYDSRICRTGVSPRKPRSYRPRGSERTIGRSHPQTPSPRRPARPSESARAFLRRAPPCAARAAPRSTSARCSTAAAGRASSDRGSAVPRAPTQRAAARRLPPGSGATRRRCRAGAGSPRPSKASVVRFLLHTRRTRSATRLQANASTAGRRTDRLRLGLTTRNLAPLPLQRRDRSVEPLRGERLVRRLPAALAGLAPRAHESRRLVLAPAPVLVRLTVRHSPKRDRPRRTSGRSPRSRGSRGWDLRRRPRLTLRW